MCEIPWWRIEKKLFNTNYSQEIKEEIINRLIELEKDDSEFAEAELELILLDIDSAYIDPITHGNYYNQTDIRNHLKNLR